MYILRFNNDITCNFVVLKLTLLDNFQAYKNFRLQSIKKYAFICMGHKIYAKLSHIEGIRILRFIRLVEPVRSPKCLNARDLLGVHPNSRVVFENPHHCKCFHIRNDHYTKI